MNRRIVLKDVGNRIAALRVRKKWSQEQLAKKINVARNTLIAYEKGDSAIRVSNIQELSEIFSVSGEYLLYGVEISNDDLYKKIDCLAPKDKRLINEIVDRLLRR